MESWTHEVHIVHTVSPFGSTVLPISFSNNHPLLSYGQQDNPMPDATLIVIPLLVTALTPLDLFASDCIWELEVFILL